MRHHHHRGHSVDMHSDDGSYSSDDEKQNNNNHNNNHKKKHDPNQPLDPPILVYHASARSIVFRDHLRRAVGHENC
jgi:hypothetical protein